MSPRLRTLACVLLSLLAELLRGGPIFADATVLPDGVREVSFSRHVVPLFSRVGCNAGICHGAVKGQGGFKLTLFGADPVLDHARVLREEFGRRVNPLDPENSLLLRKATGAVPHQGGARVHVGTPEYELLRRWIAQGARLDEPVTPRLSLTPAQKNLSLGESYRLRVVAHFGTDPGEDVTSLCTFESRDSTVAAVDSTGQVRATGIGDAALVVRYRAEPMLAQVLVPGEQKGPFPEVKEHNFIDRHVLAKLRTLHMPPAELYDDTTFLRRVSLDLAGELPTPEEVRAFLADTREDRRTRKIDELLARPGHSLLWATKFCDLLKPGNYSPNSGIADLPASRRFHGWLQAQLAKNLPYDELAERILLATSREGKSEAEWVEEVRALTVEEARAGADLVAYNQRRTLDLYWQRANAAGVKGTLQVAHAFLGLRLECAQCHRHPHDVWQQADLLDFANFFQRVTGPGGSGSSPGVLQQAERLTGEIKKLKDEAKARSDQAKAAGLSKDEMKKVQDEARELTARARQLETLSKRLKATEIHTGGKGSFAEVVSPLGRQVSREFRLLGEKQPITVSADQDPRQVVMTWLRRPENPYFARAIVNRVWAHYFGRGLIDPPDHLSPLNPPSHPELLAELEKGFIAHKYDLRWLHQTIVQSRTYQQSARTNASSRVDTRNYASFYPRRLSAELLVDALNHATGGSETYPAELRLREGARALEVAGSVEAGNQRASLAYAFRIFGRPGRAAEVQCDCERDGTPTIAQTLFLANHPRVLEKINLPGGRVAQILQKLPEPKDRVGELFLWTLSRHPGEEERRAALDLLQKSPTPEQGLRDLLWSLLNTREFLLNY